MMIDSIAMSCDALHCDRHPETSELYMLFNNYWIYAGVILRMLMEIDKPQNCIAVVRKMGEFV